MKKEMTSMQLIVIACFIGILLTAAIFYLTNMFITGDGALTSYCYDGGVIEGEDPIHAFNRAIYQSESTLTFIHEQQYTLFGVVNSNLVIAGYDNFLFEVSHDSYDYSYLEDYYGNCSFTEAESGAILENLQNRYDYYRSHGDDYLLVIIPNAQSVYSEKMPAYYGTISEESRLSRLSDYLTANGFINFIDLTDDLRYAKDDEILYHNTQNSLNALGMYYAYREVYDVLDSSLFYGTTPVERASLRFNYNNTNGRYLAKKAGLEHIISNHTLSLSGSLTQNYVIDSTDTSTAVTPPGEDTSQYPILLLQFSNAQDRLLSEPYFSNTFYKVSYQTSLKTVAPSQTDSNPRIVVQFIYESELGCLLEQE